MRLRPGLALLPIVLSSALSARAEPVPSLDLRNFHPPADPKGSLYLEPTGTPASGDWSAGAWLSYAYRSVTLEDESGDRVAIPVEHQLSLDYVAAVGVLDRLAVSLTIPTVLYQSGDDVSAYIGDGKLPQTALGDAAFGAKATLLPTSSMGGFGLAALARVTAPTGDGRSYVSDGNVTGELRLLGELRLIAVNLQATAGARIRASERRYVGEDFGHELPWGIGVGLRPQALGFDREGRWTVTAEARGQVAITPSFASGPQSPILAGLSARYAVGDVSTIAGVELPLNDAVGSPRVRAILGISWAPRFEDEDEDGVADEEDECQELAEDKDGFEDLDGCPDFDNDEDGVPDEEDKCPAEREDEDEFQDDDGCPDPDNDGDGIADEKDKCPDEAGSASGGPRGPGCPGKDGDGDGVDDGADKCPDAPEDRDGYADNDGCPDPDNDTDGVLDEDDACPTVKGALRSDAKLNGCPSPDKDGDTYDDAADKCAEQPEDFDGVEDDDGCPDDDSDKPPALRAKPLVTIELRGMERAARFRIPPKFAGKPDSVDLDPKTLPSVRALAFELNSHKGEWVALVGVQPVGKTPNADQDALNKSFALVNALRTFTHRDESAESISWAAVKGVPDAARLGLGVLIIGGQAPAPVKPPPAGAKPPAGVPPHKRITPPTGVKSPTLPLPPGPPPAPKTAPGAPKPAPAPAPATKPAPAKPPAPKAPGAPPSKPGPP